MATRLDRVTTTARRSETEVDLGLDLDQTALVRRSSDLSFEVLAAEANARPRQLRAGELGGALVSWLAGVFALCYVFGPVVLAVLGLPGGQLLGQLWYSLPAFAASAFVAVTMALVARPQIRVGARGPRDPVVSAAVGGLGVWAVLHNTTWFLVPFSAMQPLELALFFGLNVVEMTLLGMMFASFTRRRSVALALGGGFQLLTFGLLLTIFAILL